MSKSNVDKVQAQYWGGPVSRAEVQKVFDEYTRVIQSQAMAIQKLDSVITYVTEKLGVTVADVNKWVEEKIAKAKADAEAAKAAEEAQKQAKIDRNQPSNNTAPTEPSPIVLTD